MSFVIPAFYDYLAIHALICFAFLSVMGIKKLTATSRRPVPALSLRRLNHLLLILVLALPIIASRLGTDRVFKAPIQVWAEGSLRSGVPNAITKGPVVVSFATHQGQDSLKLSSLAVNVFVLVGCLFAGLLALGHLFKLWRNQQYLKNLKNESLSYRQVGGLQIFFSPKIASPFASAFGRHAWIFLPVYLLDSTHLKTVLFHEFQHLRHRDLAWNYGLEIFRALFFINPCTHRWIKEIDELHEFACDEALLGQQRVQETAYACCLLEVAEYAHHLGRQMTPIGTVGMSVPKKQLKRRIEMILRNESAKPGWALKTAAAFAMLLTATVAFAAKGLIADHRLSLSAAKLVVEKTNKTSEIPVALDENVLRFLNKGVGTERGRMYLRANFKRMKAFETMIRAKLEAAHLPEELMAIPFVESGYQNTDNGVGAGIWAFIPDTARHYGMKVEDEVDERFNAELETDAAIKYYKKLYQDFHDWPLALLAYNAGESRVREAIAKSGIHDALRLVREHHMSKEQDYLPMTMAAIAVFKNPKLLED